MGLHEFDEIPEKYKVLTLEESQQVLMHWLVVGELKDRQKAERTVGFFQKVFRRIKGIFLIS